MNNLTFIKPHDAQEELWQLLFQHQEALFQFFQNYHGRIELIHILFSSLQGHWVVELHALQTLTTKVALETYTILSTGHGRNDLECHTKG